MFWLFEVLLDVVEAVTRRDRTWLRVAIGLVGIAALAFALSALFPAGD